MKKTFFYNALLVAFFLPITMLSQTVSKHVNPFIGTAGHGHTYPGATVPFGMVQLSPDNGKQGWDWCSGYNYSADSIVGFSHTHLSGTGIGDLCDISLMPLLSQKADTIHRATTFSHKNESATPGFYQVTMDDGIKVALTTTKRVGYHQYTFPKNTQAQVQLDLGWAINWDATTSSSLKKINDSLFIGSRFSTGWAKNQKVFFALQFSKPVNSIDTLRYKNGKGLITFFNFGNANFLEAKVGLSFTSEEGALNNLKLEGNLSFEKAKVNAANAWEKELSKIKIKTKDTAVLTTFYTALYHTYMAPVLYSDAGQINDYTVHSLWDVFRAANPLFTITQPKLVPEIINSYLSFYKKKGLLPVWDLMHHETNTMTGYHAVPIIADAILKDIKGFDYTLAFTAMKASAEQAERGSKAYRQYGYLPQDKHGWSATITLEYAFDDWCIAQVAKKLGALNDYSKYLKRADSYANIFDTATGFFRAKNSKGNFLQNFDPYYSEHGFDGQYIEGTAWQHTWFVPHDVTGMINLHGGKEKFTKKLDSLWTITSKMNGDNVSDDISGMIGQYAHGNEPSHHIPYLYAAIGEQYKSAEKTRQIMQTLYKPTVDGLCGNEDCGQMSAWYVFSALGFYPMNPADGKFYFGSPLIDEATFTIIDKQPFTVKVLNNNSKNIYIKKLILNGRVYNKNYITYSDLSKGGVLEIEMTDVPTLHTKILVVGGSTGGTAAGITAARNGVATLIVEPTNWLGGMLSAAGVTATDGNHNLPSGIWEEFRQALYLHYKTKKLNTGWVSNTLFEPYVADSIFKAWAKKEENLQVLYHWYFDSAYTENNKVIGVRFINKEGKYLQVLADITIDATDLGDVYANAGAAYDVGMEDASYSGEKEAPGKNDLIQDITWAAVLKDYGTNASNDFLIAEESINKAALKEFNCCCNEGPCPSGKPYNASAQKMLDYGKLPNKKYMLNWPANGNDYAINGIAIKQIEREKFYVPAKLQTLSFVYYIQNILGFKNLGLSPEFGTSDYLAKIPYHREGRRLKGIVRLTLPYLTNAYEQPNALYKTGIAVGDYPIDHHHAKKGLQAVTGNLQDTSKNVAAPHINFPQINAYNIPLGALIPEKMDGLVVCEKGISVSNIVNGTTRLQPCVLLTGQAAGTLAATAIKTKTAPRNIAVRTIQKNLLLQQAFLMPYVDVPAADSNFTAIQKVGTTGILRGVGKKEGWANKTYFYPDSLVNGKELFSRLNAFRKSDKIIPMININSVAQLASYIVTAYPQKKTLLQNKTFMQLAADSSSLTNRKAAEIIDLYINPFDEVINHQGL